jgi:hypothetical protein
MSTPIAEAVTQDFDLKAELIASMAKITPKIETLNDLKAWDGRRLLTAPPDKDTVKALLEACEGQDSTNKIKHDVAGRTALGYVLEACVGTPATSTTSQQEEVAANAFGQHRYNEIGRKMLARVAAIDRATGPSVKEASEELDRGTLSAKSYGLNVKGILTAQEAASVKLAPSGELVIDVASTTVDLHRNGEVLEQVWRVGKKLLAAGYRPITPAAGTPLVGSVGERGSIKYKKTDGSEETVRYHLTPEGFEALMLAGVRASSTLTPVQLVAGHMGTFADAAELLTNQNYNLESALLKTLDTKTFASYSRTEAKVTAPRGDTDTIRKLQQDNANHLNTIKQLKHYREVDLEGLKPAKAQKTGKRQMCFDWHQKGKCSRGDKCPFDHVCLRCDSEEHHTMACPQFAD